MLSLHSRRIIFMSDQLTLSIVGSGGDGAVAAGDILAMACARNGLHVIKTEAYGPQIRGGESSCTVRVSAHPIYSQADAIDAIVIFSWADFARFRSELVLDAGCRFFAGYPITPSSEVLHMLAEWLPKLGGTALQTEDELSAIGAVIGASFAGVKSMTATSGPGLSLMSEMLGLSSMAEVPAVIVNVQRGGPSPGLPTKSGESDLLHAVFASHGDTPRAVIAPCDVEDSYHATVDAFNIAEEFQLPVIVLTDQLIAQRRETIDAPSLTHEVKGRRLVHPEDLEDFK